MQEDRAGRRRQCPNQSSEAQGGLANQDTRKKKSDQWDQPTIGKHVAIPSTPKVTKTNTPDSDNESIDNDRLKDKIDKVKDIIKALYKDLGKKFETIADAEMVEKAFKDLTTYFG
ncbi:hypothetical protein VTI74DRAFT_9729 [Chaetomium olivicolor]